MKTLDEVEFVLDTEMAPSEVPSEIDDFRYFIPRVRFIVSIIEIETSCRTGNISSNQNRSATIITIPIVGDREHGPAKAIWLKLHGT